MYGIANGSLKRSPARILPGLLLSIAGFSIFSLLYELLPSLETYNGFGHGFSALAAVGALGSLGYLAVHVYRSSAKLACVCSFFLPASPSDSGRHAYLPVKSADWPLLVALLFGPFLVLLAGLGGWV